MRRARYDLRKVICPNASCIGYSSNVAKPGYWVSFTGLSGQERIGRVMGRIAETPYDGGTNCAGWLAVMALHCEATSVGIAWVNPADVRACYESPPRALLAWLTGDEWVKNKGDIARILAMSQYGTTSEQFIAGRDDPEKAFNARPEYIEQFILK